MVAEIDFLKNLNERRYACELEDVESTSSQNINDYPEFNRNRYTVYKGYYNKELLNEGIPYIKKEMDDNNGKIGYYFEKEDIDANEELFEKYYIELKSLSIDELMKGNEPDDSISVWVIGDEKVSGVWYRIEDFEKAEPIIKKKLDNLKEKLDRLKALQFTKDWYEMSDDAQSRVVEDISYAEGDYEECVWKYDSLKKIINIMDFLQNNVAYPYLNELDIERYVWSYDDKREIELFVEVC